jgi:diguanylate cyclase (GGDEF)-like protein
MPQSLLPDNADTHTEAFKAAWLARFGEPGAAAEMVARHMAEAAGNERLALRMQLLQLRLTPPLHNAGAAYNELAERMLALGDRPGHVIARSFAMGAEIAGEHVPSVVAAYEQLLPEIEALKEPLEQHAALGPSLLLFQASGNLVAYMQQACRMLQLASEIGHGGMRSAAIINLGIAYFLAGDELQARAHLEESLAQTDPGSWVRFSAVTILAEIYASSGDTDKVVPLLQVWSFPDNPGEMNHGAVALLHALGAEIFARLGQADKTRAYLDFVDALPTEQLSNNVRCMLTIARAMYHQIGQQGDQARAIFAEAVAMAEASQGPRALSPRFWWLAAEVASAQGLWEQAYRLLERHRQLEQGKGQDVAAVRRVAAQYQTDASARAVEAAQRDQLTGLGNRERLAATGDSWIARRLAPVVAMLNVRRFNAINEALGREIGDAVLQAVAGRLRETCNRFENAVAGRVYADRFTLVVATSPGHTDQLREVATELFATPLDVAGQRVDISAAWGIAHCPAHGSSMHQLMSHAEVALREDRRSGSGWTVYQTSHVRADPRQLSLISELKRAAHQDEFALVLQPKFRLSDGAVTSFESLVRWNHPARGLVPPSAFIPFAESTGSIRGITEWVLRRALQLSCRLRGAGLASEIAVNVSVHDVGSNEFCETLSSLLQATGARAEDLRLELTEGAAMKDPATVIDRMRRINAMGVEWSIDDFGTGQSSLAYLHMLPVSELKIDSSFVRGAASSSTTLTLLKAAIDLGGNLGLSTVGEGAETEEEWNLLRDLGCNIAQGWFGARPMPEAELVSWLRGRAP